MEFEGEYNRNRRDYLSSFKGRDINYKLFTAIYNWGYVPGKWLAG
jgi:hypothetical protein